MEGNFLCISSYNNDLSWVKSYPNKHVVYDRSDDGKQLPSGLNVKKSKNVGYNLYDMFTFIIDNYDKLPEYTTFCKGNIFPRHLTKNKFEELMNNKFFTPLFEPSQHKPIMPICMFSSDGCWSEINSGIAVPDPTLHPTKYFNSYNDLLYFLFEDAIIPKYITFAAGANYVVPKNYILKYSVNFYKNLRAFVSHCQLAGECHLIERALYSIWLGNFKVTKQADTLINEETFFKDKKQLAKEHVAAAISRNVEKNIHTLCTIKLKECNSPYMPPKQFGIDIDNDLYRQIFDIGRMSYDICNFTFDSETEAQDYLNYILVPCVLGHCNPTFIIEKTYKKR